MVEEYKGKGHSIESEKDAHCLSQESRAPFFNSFSPKTLNCHGIPGVINHKKKAVAEAKKEKCHGRPVPETGDQHGNQKAHVYRNQGPGEKSLRREHPLIEGREKVVGEPLGEGDMLAEPKLGNIFGNEWIVEILRRSDSEKAPHPDHDIAVPGEVEIEKEVEGINAQQQLARTHLGNGHPRWGYVRDQEIGQSVRLDASQQDSQQGVEVALEGKWNRLLPAIPLFPVVVVTLDRPHHESSEIEEVVDKHPEIEGAQGSASSLDHDMYDLEEKKAEAGGGQDIR